MPAKFEIDNEKYETPNWKNITFSKFLNYLEEIDSQRPEALDSFLSEHYEEIGTIEETLNDKDKELKAVSMFEDRWNKIKAEDKIKCFNYFSLDVGFWCEIEPEVIKEAMNLEQLQQVFWLLQFEMNPTNAEIKEGFSGFEIEGEFYELPKKNMVESTVLEFSEAAQFQTVMQGVKNGEYKALADVMVVLCKPKGEKYSYSEIKHKRRKKLFLKTTMDNVINTAFFSKTKQNIEEQFSDLYNASGKSTNSNKDFELRFGWASIIYRISKSGQFTIGGSGLTSLECAENANLYEAFNYLSYENALANLNNSIK